MHRPPHDPHRHDPDPGLSVWPFLVAFGLMALTTGAAALLVVCLSFGANPVWLVHRTLGPPPATARGD